MKQFIAPGMTKWTNPLGRPTAKLHLYKHAPIIERFEHGPPRVKDSGFLDVEIPAGDSALLPSTFDDAISRRDETGVVQSGCCPWLIKNDERELEVHPSLDPVEQQRLQAEIDADAARRKKAEAEAEALKADQARAEAERLQREADKLRSDQAEAARIKSEAEAMLADAKKAKAEAEALKKQAEKALDDATKPATGEGAASNSDTGKQGGKASK